MAVIDDLVSSGLSGVQTSTLVNFNIGQATQADLAAAGFSAGQILEIVAENAGTGSAAKLTSVGFWTGTQVPAIEAALAANTAPTANAGPDQEVEVGEVVTLDGSGSFDVNGDPLTYAWTLTSKPESSTATLTGATTVSPTFTADLAGEYVASLVVNDGTVNSAPDTVKVTAANTAPTANAGPDQEVATGAEVTLDGSGSSDPNGDTLTYAWTLASAPEGSTAALTGATTVDPTFTPDLDGAYVVSLVVNDGTVNSAADTVTITAVTV